MQTDATKRFPNEILGHVLKFYIQDFFSRHVKPWRRPPAPLHVCRRWRQVAITTPECWTNLKFELETRSRYGYGRRDISQRQTRGKAAQDAIKNYFIWARNAPVDLSLTYTGNCTKEAQKKLAPWLSENMPMLGRFSSLGHSRGMFQDLWTQLKSDCLTYLTHLRLDLSIFRNDSEVVTSGQVIAPNLSVVYINGHHDVVKVLEAPKLKQLFVHIWDLGEIAMLEKFPLLRRLYLDDVRGRLPEFRHEGLHWLAMRHSWKEVYGSLTDSCKVFPNVTTWCLGPEMLKALIDHKPPELDLRFLKTLTLLDYGIGSEYYLSRDAAYLSQLITLWEQLSGLTHLTLGVLSWHGHGFNFESQINPDYKPHSPDPPDNTFAQIIYSLESGSDRQPCLPSLEQLDIQDIGLDSNLLTALRTFLRRQVEPVLIGEETNDIRGRRLTIRRSILEARQLTPPRSFGIHNDMTFTSREFEEFAADLERHGFFTEPSAA